MTEFQEVSALAELEKSFRRDFQVDEIIALLEYSMALNIVHVPHLAYSASRLTVAKGCAELMFRYAIFCRDYSQAVQIAENAERSAISADCQINAQALSALANALSATSAGGSVFHDGRYASITSEVEKGRGGPSSPGILLLISAALDFANVDSFAYQFADTDMSYFGMLCGCEAALLVRDYSTASGTCSAALKCYPASAVAALTAARIEYQFNPTAASLDQLRSAVQAARVYWSYDLQLLHKEAHFDRASGAIHQVSSRWRKSSLVAAVRLSARPASRGNVGD